MPRPKSVLFACQLNSVRSPMAAALLGQMFGKSIRTATPDKIEALDMGRRGVHNEGSRILMERLKEKVSLDMDTARRLFTLICVLHWKG